MGVGPDAEMGRVLEDIELNSVTCRRLTVNLGHMLDLPKTHGSHADVMALTVRVWLSWLAEKYSAEGWIHQDPATPGPYTP